MSSASGTTDISIKYQRLAAEFVKVRSQVSVLKNAVVEEQETSARLREQMHQKETAVRKFQDENEGLLFRNCQLVKRVEALQQSLDEVNKMHAAKGKKKQKEANLRLFVDLSDQSPNMPGTSAGQERRQLLEQELERRVIEVSELSSQLYDMEKQHEAAMRALNERIVTFEAENSFLQQELKKARQLKAAVQEKPSVLVEAPHFNGVNASSKMESDQSRPLVELPNNNSAPLIDGLKCEIVEETPSAPPPVSPSPLPALTEADRRSFEQLNQTKAEWEGAVAALESELELMRKWKDEQTTAADSVDPERKANERALDEFYRQKIKELSVDLRFARGEATYYKDECTALLEGSKTLLKNRAAEDSCGNCSALRDALEGTQRTFEAQMRQLYDQINDRDAEICEHKDQLRVLSEGPSGTGRETSFKQSFRRIVGK